MNLITNVCESGHTYLLGETKVDLNQLFGAIIQDWIGLDLWN